MPRIGLTPDRVAEAAAALLDSAGEDALTLSRLAAELGVKAPSLYNHIDGMDDLRRRIAMRGIGDLAEALRSAVLGRSGADALHHLAAAYRRYAQDHPGVYPLTQETRPDDEEYATLGLRAIEPVLAVLRGAGVPEEERIHAARALRSSLHGFVELERCGGFGLDVDIDASYEYLIDSASRAIRRDD